MYVLEVRVNAEGVVQSEYRITRIDTNSRSAVIQYLLDRSSAGYTVADTADTREEVLEMLNRYLQLEGACSSPTKWM